MNQRRSVALSMTILSVAMVTTSSAQTPQTSPETFLRNHVGWSDKEIGALNSGKIMTQVLEKEDMTEIAVFGAVVIDISNEAFTALALDVESYRGPGVKKIRLISSPPRTTDFAALTLPKDDVTSLRKCKPGSCDVKIGDQGLARLNEIDWKSDSHVHAVNELARKACFEFMGAYLQGGNNSLGRQLDKKEPLIVGQAFAGLLQNSPYLFEYTPAFANYLRDFPNASLPGATDMLFWTEEEFGLKPVVTLKHTVVYPQPEPLGVAVAIKQLYTSHYVRASVSVAGISQNVGGKRYLFRLDRARLDGLTGMMGGMVRGKVEGQTADKIEAFLGNVRGRVAR